MAVERETDSLTLVALQRASVNLLAGKAEVQYNPDTTGPRHIIKAVQEAGFEAHLLRSDRYPHCMGVMNHSCFVMLIYIYLAHHHL